MGEGHELIPLHAPDSSPGDLDGTQFEPHLWDLPLTGHLLPRPKHSALSTNPHGFRALHPDETNKESQRGEWMVWWHSNCTLSTFCSKDPNPPRGLTWRTWSGTIKWEWWEILVTGRKQSARSRGIRCDLTCSVLVLAVDWQVYKDCTACLNLSVVAIYQLLGIAYTTTRNNCEHLTIDGLWVHPS